MGDDLLTNKAFPSKVVISVRTAVIDAELNAICTLIRSLSSSAIFPDLNEFNNVISQDSIFFFLAELDGQIVGMLSLVVFSIPTGKRARIEDVVVHPDYRRNGVARALSCAAIEKAEDISARTLDLTSSPSREAANGLYIALGFKTRKTNVYRYGP